MSAMSNTVDEIHTSGSLAEKAEIFHNGRGNASSFPHSLFIPLRAPLLAPKAPKIRTTLCRRDRYDFLFALRHCLFNSSVLPETERRWSTTLATWKEVHSHIAELTKFISKLCKISATQHLNQTNFFNEAWCNISMLHFKTWNETQHLLVLLVTQ